jgi:CSLREA domain-containing protein
MILPIDPWSRSDGQLRGHKLLRLLLAGALLPDAGAAPAGTFTVNTTADVPAAAANGVCETATGNGVCSLRAAIQAANALFGADTIVLQPNVVYQLARAGVDDTALDGDLDILDSVTITGAGPGSTIIDGNGTVTGDRVFQVFGCINNSLATDGSCMFGEVVAEISGVTIEHGSSHDSGGGGVFNSAALTLADCIIADNIGKGTPGDGGGIHNQGSLTLTRSVVAGNSTSGSSMQGGGIWTSGPTVITDSTISGNATLGRGGGIFIGSTSATIRISGSTLSGNTGQAGGGIYVGGILIAINTTVSGNSSTSTGGGINVGGGLATSLYNVTIAGNISNSNADSTVSKGGGVSAGGLGTLNFKNSIIADNGYVTKGNGGLDFLVDDDCLGTMTSQGNSLMSAVDASSCTVHGSFVLADPAIGFLQDNGGPTQTHALLSGSPAIEGVVIGDCTDDLGAILTSDQRGFKRPAGTRCDIGAFELDTIFGNGFEP